MKVGEGTHTPLDDFDGPVAWRDDLDRRWPERSALREAIVDAVCAEQRSSPRIVELGIGAGDVLHSLAVAVPGAVLFGVDKDARLLEFVGNRTPAHCVHGDLNEDSWLDELGTNVDVVYSLQTFHDLGGREALVGIYQRILRVLTSGGLVINADFVVPQPHDDPGYPRRFEVAEHRRICEEAGYRDFRCVLKIGELACMTARR